MGQRLEVQGRGLLADRWWGGRWSCCLGKKNKLPRSSFASGLKRMGLLEWLVREKEDGGKRERSRGMGKGWEKKNEESRRQC